MQKSNILQKIFRPQSVRRAISGISTTITKTMPRTTVMAAMMMFAIMAISFNNANAQTTWDIGTPNATDLTATFNSGTLTISGTGDMQDFIDENAVPWYSIKDNITTLVIEDGVTTIGDWAFYHCSSISGSLTIPEGVTKIGDAAFYICSNLSGSLTIPTSVITIGDWTFYSCSGFNGSLTIPQSITTIGKEAFYFCSGFNGSLIIPQGVTTIGQLTFAHCFGFGGALTIPSSVATIGDEAFANCVGFTFVNNYATTPKTINSYVFENLAINTITLNVPAASVSLYEIAPVWQDFNIAALPIELTSIAVTTPPAKTIYTVGEQLDLTGIVVTASYSDSSTEDVTADCTSNPANTEVLNTLGTQTITISYTKGSITKTTTIYVTVNDETGIAETHLSKIEIYPNPSKGILTIENAELTNENVEIFDIFGKKLSIFNLQQSNQIDISHLSAGIYFLQIDKQTVKIIKE
jgi:hypothetical protein